MARLSGLYRTVYNIAGGKRRVTKVQLDVKRSKGADVLDTVIEVLAAEHRVAPHQVEIRRIVPMGLDNVVPYVDESIDPETDSELPTPADIRSMRKMDLIEVVAKEKLAVDTDLNKKDLAEAIIKAIEEKLEESAAA